jgi:hypothetical protein
MAVFGSQAEADAPSAADTASVPQRPRPLKFSTDMRDGLQPRRVTTAMWDYSWLTQHYPGGPFAGFDKAVDELRERGSGNGNDEDRVSEDSSVAMCLALKPSGVSAELHIDASGGHGFGLRQTGKRIRSRAQIDIRTWTEPRMAVRLTPQESVEQDTAGR